MVLDEQKQIELSLITPKGSADTALQLELRDKTIKSQEHLYNIVNNSPVTNVPHNHDNNYHLLLNLLEELLTH